MRARTVNENQEFERGKDPKEALNLGIKTTEDYIKLKFKQAGSKDLDTDLSEFWDVWHEFNTQGEDEEELNAMVIDIIKKSPPAYGRQYVDPDIAGFLEDELPSLYENLDFERGKDPKKAMGIGIVDYSSYVKSKLKQMFPDKKFDDVESEFWEMFGEGFEDMKSYDFADSILGILKHTPLKYQMEYMDGDLEAFEEGVEEGYITI